MIMAPNDANRRILEVVKESSNLSLGYNPKGKLCQQMSITCLLMACGFRLQGFYD